VKKIFVDKEHWEEFNEYGKFLPGKAIEPDRQLYDNNGIIPNPAFPFLSAYLKEREFKPFWPDGYKFAVCLTHDIDNLKPPRLGRVPVPYYLRKPLITCSKKFKAAWDLEKIIDLETEYNAKSSFFFLALEYGDESFNYRIDELKIEIDHIKRRGWDIGLHGGHNASIDAGSLKREKKRLLSIVDNKIAGYRGHYLKLRKPTTWKMLVNEEFEYDTTFGYPNRVGFRNGLCYPFRPFDALKNEYIDIIEIPLALMDATLFSSMNLNINESWIEAKKVIDNAIECEGVVTILWHNTNAWDKNLTFYRKILLYVNKAGGWLTSGAEINAWWKKHNDYLICYDEID